MCSWTQILRSILCFFKRQVLLWDFSEYSIQVSSYPNDETQKRFTNFRKKKMKQNRQAWAWRAGTIQEEWVRPFLSRNGWTEMSEWAVRHRIKKKRQKELCFAPFENKKNHKGPHIGCSEIITCLLHCLVLFLGVVISWELEPNLLLFKL
jgi:hypothetical protein